MDAMTAIYLFHNRVNITCSISKPNFPYQTKVNFHSSSSKNISEFPDAYGFPCYKAFVITNADPDPSFYL